jgi:hypothetical protein
MTTTEPQTVDAAEAMRLRLRADLRIAMKQRRRQETTALRIVIAALDNAEAVPIVAMPRDYRRAKGRSDYVVTGDADGPTEVTRRLLSETDVQRVIRDEYQAMRDAAEQRERVGQSANDLYSQADIIGRYVHPLK